VGKVQLKKNFFKIFATKEISEKRFFECKKCEHLKIGFCKQCGCLMAAKTKILSAQCPLGKWQDHYFNEQW
jgi:hypothetical protein